MGGVEEEITPSVQEKFDAEMTGLGQGYPMVLRHQEPIKVDEESIQFLKKSGGPTPEDGNHPVQ